MVRIRTWWHCMLLGLVLGVVAGAAYGVALALLPVVPDRVWLASLPTGWALLAGAGLGLVYGAGSGAACGLTLSADTRFGAWSDRSRFGVPLSAAVAAAIAVVVVFLLVALGVWLLRHGVDLSDSNLVAVVVVPALVAAGVAAAVAQFLFGRGASGEPAGGPADSATSPRAYSR